MEIRKRLKAEFEDLPIEQKKRFIAMLNSFLGGTSSQLGFEPRQTQEQIHQVQSQQDLRTQDSIDASGVEPGRPCRLQPQSGIFHQGDN